MVTDADVAVPVSITVKPEKKENATLNISGDTVKQTLKKQIEKGEVTQSQADLVWWYYAYSKQNGYSLSLASLELGYDANSTLFRLWTGTYGAKIDKICAKIERFKKIAEERDSTASINFVETTIAKAIARFCDAALYSQTIAFIYGDSQIGKTTALMEYARLNNHGQTKYIRMPASAGVQIVAKEIARACFVSTSTCFENLRESILNSIDHNTLIIIDEVHQCFLSYQKGSQMKILEFIREIYDRTQCGMVLCGTNVLKEEIQQGKLARMLEQLRRRGTHPLQLPAKPPKKDLDKIAAAFRLPPPDGDALEIVRDMIHRSGLGMYVKFLQTAGRIAKKENKKLSWDHFILAHDLIQKLSEHKEEK